MFPFALAFMSATRSAMAQRLPATPASLFVSLTSHSAANLFQSAAQLVRSHLGPRMVPISRNVFSMPPSLALSSAALKVASDVDVDARSYSADVRSLAAAWDFLVRAPSALKSIVASTARDLSAATTNVPPPAMELALPGTFDPACAVMVDPAMAAIIDPESVTLIEPRTVTVVEAGAVTVFDTDIAFSHVVQSGAFYEAGFSEVGMDGDTGVEWGGSSEILHSLLQDAGADFNLLMDILNLELAQHQDDKDVGWEDLL